MSHRWLFTDSRQLCEPVSSHPKPMLLWWLDIRILVFNRCISRWWSALFYVTIISEELKMHSNCRWSVDWKSVSSHSSTQRHSPRHTAPSSSLPHIPTLRVCRPENVRSQPRCTGSLTSQLPPWWFPNLASAGSRSAFLPEEAKCHNRGKGCEQQGGPRWERRRKVGPKILNRSFYRNGEREMVSLKLIHLLQTLLVLMPPCSFLDSVPHPRTSPSLLFRKSVSDRLAWGSPCRVT